VVPVPTLALLRARFRAWITPARGLLILAACIRICTAIWDQGIVWPDELFQTLEQAHRFAFGRGVIPWEFRDGARSWLFPGMLGLVFKAASAVGVTHALTLLRIVKLGMAALAVWGVWLGMRLARLLGGARAELLAALFGALCPVLVIFSTRCMTECASAPFIVAAGFLMERRRSRWDAALAGAAIGLTVLFRCQNGLLAITFWLVLLASRRWKDSLAYVGGGLVLAVLGGLLDWKTWGYPFRPVYVYVTWTAKGNANGWGTSPWNFFSDHLETTVGLSYVLLALGFFVATGASRGLVFIVLSFLLVHLKVPHKELRFIVPIIPLALALSAVGLAKLMSGLHQGMRPSYALAVVCGLQMAWQLRAPTLDDLGYSYGDEPVWHANEDYFRATFDAGAAPDLCGLSYTDSARAWTGGYTYLHRNVPIFFDTDPRNLAAANYVVGEGTLHLPAAWRKVSVHGKYALFHRDGECGPTPPGWNLDVL
jgi:phosphatidylinositol glycan class B